MICVFKRPLTIMESRLEGAEQTQGGQLGNGAVAKVRDDTGLDLMMEVKVERSRCILGGRTGRMREWTGLDHAHGERDV